MILILQHVKDEGPGTIANFFDNSGWQVRIIRLYEKERLPDDLSDVEAAIIMGGPMNVYEEDKFPFLKDENRFLNKAMDGGVLVLGICLGAQLLAKAAGAKVAKAQSAEIGWGEVVLTEEGQKDGFFGGLGKRLRVFQWHEDYFELPPGATLLAKNDCSPNQAYRLGKNCYGLQFHIEVDASLISAWTGKHFRKGNDEMCHKADRMLLDYYINREEFNNQANRIYLNFSRFIPSVKVAA